MRQAGALLQMCGVSTGSKNMSGFSETAKPVHVPVLLSEVLEALSPRPGGRYLDGTLGLAGHASALLERCGEIELCGLDRDASALELAARRLAPWGERVHLVHSRYSDFAAALDGLGWGEVDGVLLDIGVSSLQIDTPERGFSFQADGPLDMRMDRDSDDAPVARLVNRAAFDELKTIIARYGEDPLAARIARAVVDARAVAPLQTTRELAAVVERAYPAAWRARARNHPATRTFQALRMAVNDELGELERFMDAVLDRLAVGGRLAVITFHSLEDRLVKRCMRVWARGCVCPPHLPVCVCGRQPLVRLPASGPVCPSEAEIAANPRARSAKLRVAEKLPPAEPGMSVEERLQELARACRAAEEAFSGLGGVQKNERRRRHAHMFGGRARRS